MKSSADGVKTNIRVCIPALDELEWLPRTLGSFAQQTCDSFCVVVCINQPESWRSDPGKREICANNDKTLKLAARMARDLPYPLHLVDRCSPGRGWKPRQGGAGAARREAMDFAMKLGGEDILLVSADADSLYDPDYLKDIAERFSRFPHVEAIAAPYYHAATGDDAIDRAMLEYELFMRFYLLNLIGTGSPYAFTAIGSALAVTGKGYRAIGGMPPKPVGEDFYLLQKSAKRSKMLLGLDSRAYPAARYSHRVAYGTGPALRDGTSGNTLRYAIIHPRHFEKLHQLYQCFQELYRKNIPTPADAFTGEIFGENIWEKLRQNVAGLATFTKACHQKFDGLRIWQWMRREAAGDNPRKALYANLELHLPGFAAAIGWDGASQPALQQLVQMREAVVKTENERRFAHDAT
ncbi:MAG TPA: glycosyltransferase family A protein [Bacteroidales bacterium]|nr:glycosyltransferase family A protein [Bacteroidales bacterium]